MLRKCKTKEDKTRQDETDETQHTAFRATAEIPASDASNASEIPASDAWNASEILASDVSNASEVQGYRRKEKTRQTKQNTLLLAQPQRSPPRMHGMLPTSKTMDNKTRQEERNTSVQDNDPRFGCIECFGQFTRAIFWENLQVKCRGSKWWIALCASLRSRNALGYFTRAILCEKYGENAVGQDRGPHFVRACTIEMHADIVQEPFCGEIYKYNVADQLEHPDRAP